MASTSLPRLGYLFAGACVFAAAAVAQPRPAAPPAQIAASSDAVLPDREQEYIAIVEKARKQYAAAKSVDGRRSARIALQINVHAFMGLTHTAQDWVGVYKDNKRAANGDRSIEIEIAPGVILTTWDDPYVDVDYRTMVRPYSPMAGVIDGLTIGQPVRFSANLIGMVIDTDDAMVRQPRVIARFSKLVKLSDAGAP